MFVNCRQWKCVLSSISINNPYQYMIPWPKKIMQGDQLPIRKRLPYSENNPDVYAWYSRVKI